MKLRRSESDSRSGNHRDLLGRVLGPADPRRFFRLLQDMRSLRDEFRNFAVQSQEQARQNMSSLRDEFRTYVTLAQDEFRTSVTLARQEAQQEARQTGESLAWLAERHAEDVAGRGAITVGPLVSVIMPVWNREAYVATALDSVLAQSYRNWELLVVDDGSTDGSKEVVGGYLSDPRIRLFSRPHAGVCAARNYGLSEVDGAVIAYLDSDNVWYPHYLQEVIRGFDSAPEAGSLHLAQLVRDTNAGTAFIRGKDYDRARMEIDNDIDLNVFAHRRELLEELGGFDPTLTRGEDWDLILRYTKERPPLRLPFIGGIYEMSAPGRILTRVAAEPNVYRIRAKLRDRLQTPLTVLYVVPVNGSWADQALVTEIDCLRNWGVDVEIWSTRPGCLPTAFRQDIRVHSDSLADAVDNARPDIIHIHCESMLAELTDLDLAKTPPVTLRERERQPQSGGSEASLWPTDVKIQPVLRPSTPPAFSGAFFYPEPRKDRRLVLQVATAPVTADVVAAAIELANGCPEHRFVLAAAEGLMAADEAAGIAATIDGSGEAIELRKDAGHEEIAALTRRAGIRLLDAGPPDAPPRGREFVEAMASGCYILAPGDDVFDICMEGTGHQYSCMRDAARQIAATALWSEAEWERIAKASAEKAFREYADTVVYRPVLDQWLALAGQVRSDRMDATAREATGP